MSGTISQREMRNDSAAVLRRVESGESLTVTRHGRPVAEIVPFGGGSSGTRWVAADDFVQAVRGLPPWQADDFARELDELAALVDDDQDDPWR